MTIRPAAACPRQRLAAGGRGAALVLLAVAAAAGAQDRFPPLPPSPPAEPPPVAGQAPRRPQPPQLKIDRDLAYATPAGAALRLDLYRRVVAGTPPQPVVVWLHDDRGPIDDRAMSPAVRLVAAGYAVASIDFRAAGAGPAAQLADVKAAVRWLRANAATYGLDPDHVGVWGAGTGGTLAALLGTTGGVAALEGDEGHPDQSSRVQAVVDFFGPHGLAGAVDPAAQADAKDPSVLIVHGTADTVVPGRESELLQLGLMRAGVDNNLEYAIGADHDALALDTSAIAEEVATFFDRHLRSGRHQRDDTDTIKEPDDCWIDPFAANPPGTRTMLYAMPSRGPQARGSYRLYLPPGYDLPANARRRYPVIYFLHGFTDDSREGLTSGYVARLDAAIRSGVMPAAIVVLVQSPNASSYIDAPGVPAESAVIKDLIPTIDRTYRTIASRAGRAIDGHSMGGTGALKLGFKFPDLFGTVSAISPAMTSGNNPGIVLDDPETPWGMVAANADRIRGRTHIRIIEGSADAPPRGGLLRDEWMAKVLDRYRLAHDFTLSPGATHPVRDELSRLPTNPFAFYKTAFAGAR